MKIQNSSRISARQKPLSYPNMGAVETTFEVVEDALEFFLENVLEAVEIYETDKILKPYNVKHFLQLANVMTAITRIPYDKNESPSYDGDNWEPSTQADSFMP